MRQAIVTKYLKDEVDAHTREDATEAFRAKHGERYEFRFPVRVDPGLDAKNASILAERIAALDAVEGPRVGDYVRFADGVERRISYIWSHDGSAQTSDGGSYYLGNGYVSMSGSLYGSVPGSTLSPTDDKRLGPVWFFDHDIHRAHSAVYADIEFRVFSCSLPSRKW